MRRSIFILRLLVAIVATVATVACGASPSTSLSAAPVDTTSPVGFCGDGFRNGAEVCDDGARTCQTTDYFCFQCIRCAGRVLVRNYRRAPVANNLNVFPQALPDEVFCTARFGNGDTEERTFDALGRPVLYQRVGQHARGTRFVYRGDEWVQQFDMNGDGNFTQETSERVDASGRLVEVRAVFRTMRYEYDEQGLRRSMRLRGNGLINATEFSYDASGFLTRAVSTREEDFAHRYEEGRRVETYRVSESGDMERVGWFEYDARGRLLVKHHEEPGHETRWSYDERGAVVARTESFLPSYSYRYTYDGPRIVAFEQAVVSEDGARYSERYRYEVVGTQMIETVDIDGAAPLGVYSMLPQGRSENRYELGCLARFEGILPS